MAEPLQDDKDDKSFVLSLHLEILMMKTCFWFLVLSPCLGVVHSPEQPLHPCPHHAKAAELTPGTEAVCVPPESLPGAHTGCRQPVLRAAGAKHRLPAER